MNPITFSCQETLPFSPEAVVAQILDLSNWPKFTGYGPLPGIRVAEFEVRTPQIVGTRVRVTNTDGSKHVEEIVQYQENRKLVLHMKEFSAPLSRLATGIIETWEFEKAGDGTHVSRSFAMHAKSWWAKPMLWMISRMLKKAIARNLIEMRQGS